MKERKATLVDLHYDILKEIFIRVARSSDGAKHFANAISVCKYFRSFVHDRDTLRVVSFDRLEIDGRWELFQKIGGLICRCAKAGQKEAQFILDKIILKSTEDVTAVLSQNEGSFSSTRATTTIQVFLFLHNFAPVKNLIGYDHVDFVKIFLSPASVLELKIASSAMVRKVRDMCIGFSHALQKQGVEKDELCGIELELDYIAQTTMVEKLDMLIKRLSDAEAIKERFHQLFQHSSKVETFDFSSMKKKVEAHRARVSDFQEARRTLVAKFHTSL